MLLLLGVMVNGFVPTSSTAFWSAATAISTDERTLGERRALTRGISPTSCWATTFTASSSTRCSLFFRSTEETSSETESSLSGTTSNKRYNPAFRTVLTDLAQPNARLPYRCSGEAFSKLSSSESVTVRLMQKRDIEFLTDMCCREYGTTWDEKESVQAVESILDVASLRILVQVTLQMKVPSKSQKLPPDHVVLVATVDKVNSDTVSRPSPSSTIVGMIEISNQPALPENNPGPVPIPLWMKNLYCQVLHVVRGPSKMPYTTTQGWIANLLVSDEWRGQGVGKLLVRAAEGVARTWGTSSIHLHCDADSVSGKVSQNLYDGQGYRKLQGETQYEWMNGTDGAVGPSPLTSSVFVIEGVPLLYLKKDLEYESG